MAIVNVNSDWIVDGTIYSGQDDTRTGNLYLYGGSSTTGGELRIYNGASSDTTVDYWRLNSLSGVLSIQSNVTSGGKINLSTNGFVTILSNGVVSSELLPGSITFNDVGGNDFLNINGNLATNTGVFGVGDLTSAGNGNFMAYSQSTGLLSLTNQVAATTDTDKFVVFDGSELKYRTGVQLLADIGAAEAISFGSDNEIPFVNAGGDDFDYFNGFNFNGSATTPTLTINGSASASVILNGSREMVLTTNTTQFLIADNGAGGAFFRYNNTGWITAIGDVDGINNGLNITINDATQAITMGNVAGTVTISGTTTINGNLTADSFIKDSATSDDILLGDGTTTSLADLASLPEPVVTTQAAAIGTGGYWVQVATYNINANFGGGTLTYLMNSSNNGSVSSAMVTVSIRRNSLVSDYTLYVDIHSLLGTDTDFLGADSFKLVSNDATDIELWVQKKVAYGVMKVYELGQSVNATTVTYETNPAWVATTPTGTGNDAISEGILSKVDHYFEGDTFVKTYNNSGNLSGVVVSDGTSPFGSSTDVAQYFYRWTGTAATTWAYAMGIDASTFTISRATASANIGSHSWSPVLQIANGGASTFTGSLTANSFIKASATSDDILLGDGTTTSLSGLGGGGFTVITKTADETKNNDTTLALDDELFFTSEANGTYVIQAVLRVTGDAVPDMKIRTSGPTGSTGKRTSGTWASTAGAATSDISAVSGITLSGVTAPKVISFWVYMVTSTTTGSIGIEWAQNTSDAADSTMQKGSFIKYLKVT